MIGEALIATAKPRLLAAVRRQATAQTIGQLIRTTGGRIRADRFTTERGRLEASSGGSVEATVTARVRANASSGGHIEILGNPGERDVNSSSGGHVSIRP